MERVERMEVDQWLSIFKTNTMMALIVPPLNFKSLFRLLTATCTTLRHRITKPPRMPPRLSPVDKERYKKNIMAWRNMMDMPRRIKIQFGFNYRDTPTHSALRFLLTRLRSDAIELKHPATHKQFHCYGGCGKTYSLSHLVSREFSPVNVCYSCVLVLRFYRNGYTYCVNTKGFVLEKAKSEHYRLNYKYMKEYFESQPNKDLSKHLREIYERSNIRLSLRHPMEYYPQVDIPRIKNSFMTVEHRILHFLWIPEERIRRYAREEADRLIREFEKIPEVHALLHPRRSRYERDTKRKKINYAE